MYNPSAYILGLSNAKTVTLFCKIEKTSKFEMDTFSLPLYLIYNFLFQSLFGNFCLSHTYSRISYQCPPINKSIDQPQTLSNRYKSQTHNKDGGREKYLNKYIYIYIYIYINICIHCTHEHMNIFTSTERYMYDVCMYLKNVRH